jgi:hypothetical protein
MIAFNSYIIGLDLSALKEHLIAYIKECDFPAPKKGNNWQKE